MDYRFTALLIVMITLLALFGGPAHSKNEYLNNGTNTCSTGSVKASIKKKIEMVDTIIIMIPTIIIMMMKITEQQ